MESRAFTPARRARFGWDSAKLRIVRANDAALAFWGEASARELFERVFVAESSMARALQAAADRLADGAAEVETTIAFRPRGDEARMRVRVTKDAGREILVELLETSQDEAATPDFGGVGFEAAPRSLAVFAKDGGVLSQNQADRAEFAGAPSFVGRFADAAAAARAFAAALADGGVSLLLEGADGVRRRTARRRAFRSDGEVCVVLESAPAPKEGEAGGAVEIETLAQIAHDLRAPLAAAQGAIDFLTAADGLSEADRLSYLRDISAECAAMTARVDRLIALGAAARAAEAGAVKFVDLVQIARDVARRHGSRVAAAGATMEIDAPEGRIMALADPATVANVLAAFVDNALTHARPPAPEPLRIRIAARSGAVTALEVADNGRGLDASAMSRLAVGDGATTRVGVAGGFGLSGASADARSMAARIELGRGEEGGLSARLVFSAHR